MVIGLGVFTIYQKTRPFSLARMLNGAAIEVVYLGFLEELVTKRGIG